MLLGIYHTYYKIFHLKSTSFRFFSPAFLLFFASLFLFFFYRFIAISAWCMYNENNNASIKICCPMLRIHQSNNTYTLYISAFRCSTNVTKKCVMISSYFVERKDMQTDWFQMVDDSRCYIRPNIRSMRLYYIWTISASIFHLPTT